jgi:16S rRNA (guanine527-N7)-methyltransferase
MRFQYPDLPEGIDVSRETTDLLKAFLELVEKWNGKINLVAPSTLAEGWDRHVVDSAQIFRYAEGHGAKWLDIGSGGGFPGIVIAIMARQLAPGVHVTMVESDKRKCVFLREACRELNISAKVICDRVENLAPFGASILSARAMASLDQLLTHVSRHLAKDGVALLPKGRNTGQELADAHRNWAFQSESHESLTDPAASIVKIWGLRHV